MDDGLFEKIAEDPSVCEEMLRIMLDDNDLTVVHVIPQNSIKNLQGRSVRLDALCVNGNGNYFNIEVQKANNDDHLRRVRYNASSITANITSPGDKFKDIPDVYIIYISKFDMFANDKTIYHIDSVIRETGVVVDNGLHEVYINATIDDGTVLAEMMKYFVDSQGINQKFPKLSERTMYFKESKEGVNIMSTLLEDYIKEAAKEANVEMGKEMLREGINLKSVIKILQKKLNISEKEAEELLRS